MPDTLRTLTDEERSALALLDEGADIAEAIAATGLTQAQIVDANNVRAVARRTNGGLTAERPVAADGPVPVIEVPLPAPEPVAVAALLERADAIGGKRALFLAARIRADVEDLAETLAEDEATFAARQRVAQARAELEAAEASLRVLAGTPEPRRAVTGKAAKPAKKTAAKKRPTRGGLLYSQQVREWARGNGFEPGAHGRMRNEVVEAYRLAHADGAPAE
jgi:hypothetical protein